MKIIVTGSLGNISKPLVQKLIVAGHQVVVISGSANRIAEIEELGASAAIGSVSDQAFVTETFDGSDAVYTMVPPNFGASDWKQYIAGIGEIYASAIKSAGVKYVVNLSSIGAHMSTGCGPVSGLYFVEQALNALDGVHVKHLRPGFFFTNFLGNIGMIKHMNMIGGNYGESTKLILTYPGDIADAVAEELLNHSFSGNSIRYVKSDEITTDEVAKILGDAVGKPDLKWVNFDDENIYGAMIQNGLPEEIAKNYTEMGAAMRKGEMTSEYLKSTPVPFGKTNFKAFAPIFAKIYSQS